MPRPGNPQLSSARTSEPIAEFRTVCSACDESGWAVDRPGATVKVDVAKVEPGELVGRGGVRELSNVAAGPAPAGAALTAEAEPEGGSELNFKDPARDWGGAGAGPAETPEAMLAEKEAEGEEEVEEAARLAHCGIGTTMGGRPFTQEGARGDWQMARPRSGSGKRGTK